MRYYLSARCVCFPRRVHLRTCGALKTQAYHRHFNVNFGPLEFCILNITSVIEHDYPRRMRVLGMFPFPEVSFCVYLYYSAPIVYV